MIPLRRVPWLAESMVLAYGMPLRARRMRDLYAGFMQPGDVCFDIGAHVGGRVRIWKKLGARVVAVEPLSDCARILRAVYGRDTSVAVVEGAVGASDGEGQLLVSDRAPRASTLSREWSDTIVRAPGFSRLRWDAVQAVSIVTLDALIKQHGVPAFCKIDTEGYDLEVLNGLTMPIPALSFEFMPPVAGIARGCIGRLSQLAGYAFNWSFGETMVLALDSWVSAADMLTLLDHPPTRYRSGDVYARIGA